MHCTLARSKSSSHSHAPNPADGRNQREMPWRGGIENRRRCRAAVSRREPYPRTRWGRRRASICRGINQSGQGAVRRQLHRLAYLVGRKLTPPGTHQPGRPTTRARSARWQILRLAPPGLISLCARVPNAEFPPLHLLRFETFIRN